MQAYPKKAFEFPIPIRWLEVSVRRYLFLTFTFLILSASTIQADISPQVIIPPEPKDSPVPLLIAGAAVSAGVVLLGLWLARKRRSGKSQDQ